MPEVGLEMLTSQHSSLNTQPSLCDARRDWLYPTIGAFGKISIGVNLNEQ